MAIEKRLSQRLPDRMQRHASAIAEDVLVQLPFAYAPAPNRIATALQQTDGFARLHEFCLRYAIWPVPELASPRMLPVPPFDTVVLPELPTPADLADWLMVPVPELEKLADLTDRFEAHGETAINHYHYSLIRKVSGKVRLIEAPKERLKSIQRRLLRGLLDLMPLHPCVYGFVKGRNCVDAATRHAGEAVVVCFDLRDFFPQLGRGRVYGLFRAMGYPHNVSRLLTAICTTVTPPRIRDQLEYPDRQMFRAAHLPQGAPTSPALANHLAFALDRRLQGLAERLGARYSRYADDLTFSGDATVARVVTQAVPRIVAEEGFFLNAEKTRVQYARGRQVVTGIVVNQHLNVTRQEFDRLKAEIHACGKSGDPRLDQPEYLARLTGRIAWVASLNPARGEKLQHLLEAALHRRQVG